MVRLKILKGLPNRSNCFGIIENSRREVCRVNSQEVGRMYQQHLNFKENEHSVFMFSEFLRQ